MPLPESTSNEMETYSAIAFQVRCDGVNSDDTASARVRMGRTIDRLAAQIGTVKALIPNLRLVVLPEYFLTGFPMGESIAEWRDKAAISMDGPEAKALAAIASENKLYLSGNAYELDEHFHPLYFQCCFVHSPSGELVLNYRRLVSMFAPSPLDVWDRYIDRYGIDAVFPVAETPLGRLAAIASEEILYPEIARAHALKGAEVFLHNSAEFGSPRATPKEICRLARAVENAAYLVSANSASIEGTAIPAATTDGMSKIIDYRGLVLAEAGQGETMAAVASIDLLALRRHRSEVGMANYLARVPAAAAAPVYSALPVQPVNELIGAKGEIILPDRSFFRDRQRRVIAMLRESGRL